MKKVGIITATRAEYGLLRPVISELRKKESNDFCVELIVTGTHLSNMYGHTIDEIQNDSVRIDHTIQIPVEAVKESDISYNQARTLEVFTEFFVNNVYDGVIILGDRYEMLAIAIAASNMHIPIFHLCGGDTTEGAMDEWIRHSITKMSYLHFVTNKDSERRVVQLGENPDRVFLVGSTSIDNILSVANMSKFDALSSIGLKDCKYALCTYHPVTMEEEGVEHYVQQFIDAISVFSDLQFIITKSNADNGGVIINSMLDDAEKKNENIHVFASLGAKRYLSLMKNAEFVIGNSSSGIIEAPSFGIPTINIGDRQKGRLQCESILNCAPQYSDIVDAIKYAISSECHSICLGVTSPYGDGKAAVKIADIVYKTIVNGDICLKKEFYNL